MAEFLTREGIVDNIHKIIKEAEEELILISPYINIKADDEINDLLKDTKRGTAIHVVYGKSKSAWDLENVRSSFDLPGIRISYLEDLHAKCYMNERGALVTSMNLLEFSLKNNDEMGILVSKENDPDLYIAIEREAHRLIEASEADATGTSRPESQGVETSVVPKDDAASKPQRIYVGNLSFQATDEDLQELFGQHGQVDFAQVIIDRYSMWSRGFGFVDMPDSSEARAAISALNGNEHMGRTLTVNEATPRK